MCALQVNSGTGGQKDRTKVGLADAGILAVVTLCAARYHPPPVIGPAQGNYFSDLQLYLIWTIGDCPFGLNP
jgi:hypothetical protein